MPLHHTISLEGTITNGEILEKLCRINLFTQNLFVKQTYRFSVFSILHVPQLSYYLPLYYILIILTLLILLSIGNNE